MTPSVSSEAIYRSMVAAAAERLRARIRQGDLEAKVWAIPTTDDSDGALCISPVKPSASARLVRPSDHSASTFKSWRSTPFAEFEQILWLALRHDPILPLNTSEV